MLPTPSKPTALQYPLSQAVLTHCCSHILFSSTWRYTRSHEGLSVPCPLGFLFLATVIRARKLPMVLRNALSTCGSMPLLWEEAMDGASIQRYFSTKQNAEGKRPSLTWQETWFPFPETKAGGLQCCEHHTAPRQCRGWGGRSSWPWPRAVRATDQCHLEESSIVLIFVSSVLHEIIPNMLFHTAQNRQKFCPVFSAVTFYCFSCFVS